MANEANESTKWLYEQLKGKGYNVGKDVEEFDSLMRTNADSRQWAYDTAKKSGLNVGKDIDEFSSLVSPGRQEMQSLQVAPARSSAPEANEEAQPSGITPLPLSRPQEIVDAFNSNTRSLTDRAKNMAEYMRHGESLTGTVAKRGVNINPNSGNLEQTYLTPTGVATRDENAAKQISYAYRRATGNLTIAGQLRNEQSKLKELSEKRRKLGVELKNAPVKIEGGFFANLGYNKALVDQAAVANNDDIKALDLAIRQSEERISKLQRQSEEKGGKDIGFWRGFGDVVTDLKTWDMGISNAQDAATMLNISKKKESGDKISEAEESALESIYDNQNTPDVDNFWFKAGTMTGEMLPFMLDFAMMGGSGSGSSIATRNINAMLLRSLHKAAPKAARNKAVQWTTKVLGTIPEDLLVKAPLMTNTVQAGKTASDIVDRKLGDVVLNEDGSHDFYNDKTWGSAVWQSEANNIIENYSEMFGTHLEGVLSLKTAGKLAETFGAKRLSGILAKASNSELAGIAGTMQEHLNRLGVSDYVGEVGEEYYGQLWRTMLNLDDAYKQNPDGSRTNLFLDGQFHGDIWGGMALSMGLIGAGKYSVSAAAYGSMKHQVNKADIRASEIFTPEIWESWRERIDGTTNDKIDEISESILADPSLTDEQKNAAMNYMESSLNLRGFNLASVARQRGGEISEDEAAINESYMDGYSATTPEEMNDAKHILELQRQRLASALSEDVIPEFDSDPIGSLSRTHDPELRNIASDYVNAKQVYDGMIQRVRDDIDGRIAQSDTMIDSRVNRNTNMIQPATMKIDNRQVYIVNGAVSMLDDGTGIDTQNSSESIIIRDAATGKIEFADPTQFLSVDDAIDAEIEKEAAREKIRNEVAQTAANNIDGVLSFTPGESYSILDAQDNQQPVSVLGQPVDENNTPLDGYVDVQFPDGSIETVTTSDLQEWVDAARMQRVSQFGQERENSFDNVGVHENPETVPNLEENTGLGVENGQNAVSATENNIEQPSVEPNPTALSQIPVGEDGEPAYEQAEPDTAWDALVEQTEGDEDIARSVIEQTVSEKEEELKKLSKQKTKGGLSTVQKIQAEKEKKKAMDDMQKSIDHWKRMADTKQRRQAQEEAKRVEEARRLAEESRIKAEQERAEREEAERIEREALNGIPDWSHDTPQDARARGYRRNGPQKVDRQENVESVQGKEVEVKFGENELPKGHAAIIDAASLQPSHIQGSRNPVHFLDEAQPKERDDAASVLSAQKIASNIRPEEITSSVTAYTGAPSVNPRGETIQGNSRSDALRLMYENQPEQVAKYKQYLIDHAADYGLTPEQIESVERPVLVNMLDVTDDEAIRLGQFVAQDTESGGIERIKPKNVIQKMGNKMRSFANILLRSTDDESSLSQLIESNGLETLQWMSANGFITDTQYSSALDSKGELSPKASEDLKGILYQNIFSGASTRLEEVFNTIPTKAQRAILATAFRDYDSAKPDKMNGEIQQSVMAFHDLSSYAPFVEATNLASAFAAAEAWKNQYAMDDVTGESYLPAENFSNFALKLAAIYKGGTQKFIQQIFNDLFDTIQGTAQDTLFEEADKTPKSLAEAIKKVLDLEYKPIKKNDYGNNGSNAVDIDTPQGETGRSGSDGDPAGGERETDSHEPTDSGKRAASNSGQRSEVASQSKLFKYFAGSIKDLIELAKGTTTVLLKKIVAPINVRLQQDLASFGIDISEDYKHVIDNNAIRHAIKNHGGQQEEKRGQIPLIDADFERIEDVVSNYDHINIENGKRNNFNILYSKEYNDGITIFVEEKRDGRKELAAVTMWKKKNPTLTDANHNVTPISDSSEVSGHKVTNSASDKQEVKAESSIGERIATAEAEVNTEPTEKQKEAGNYKKGHVQVGTFDVTIENPKGSVRRGTDADGKQWETTMTHTYGYIRGTKGVDGDHIDVYLSSDIDEWDGRKAFVVDQYNPDGSFDEHKVMLGFNDKDKAFSAYLSNYESGWENGRRLDVSAASLDDFEKWIESSKRKTKPFAEYKNVKSDSESDKSKNATIDVTESENESFSGIISNEDLSKLDEDQRKELTDYLSKYPCAPIVVIANDADIDKLDTPDWFKKDLKDEISYGGTIGGYCNLDRKIYIFANAEAICPIHETLLHENVHAIVDRLGDDCTGFLNSFMEAVSTSPFNRHVFGVILDGIKEEYVEEKITNEFLAYSLQYAQRHPKIIEQIKQELNPETLEYLETVIFYKLYGQKQETQSPKIREVIHETPHGVRKEDAKDIRGISIRSGERTTDSERTGNESESTESPKKQIDGRANKAATEKSVARIQSEKASKDNGDLPGDRRSDGRGGESRTDTTEVAGSTQPGSKTIEPSPSDNAQKNPSGNKLVTDEQYADLLAKMRKKMSGQLNMGVDPEILAIGSMMAVYHIEKGARKFAEYVKAMAADLGEKFPARYLKGFYKAAHEMIEDVSPEIAEEMDSDDMVNTADVASIISGHVDAMATATMVVEEEEAEKERKEATQKLKDKRNKDTADNEEQTSQLSPNIHHFQSTPDLSADEANSAIDEYVSRYHETLEEEERLTSESLNEDQDPLDAIQSIWDDFKSVQDEALGKLKEFYIASGNSESDATQMAKDMLGIVRAEVECKRVSDARKKDLEVPESTGGKDSANESTIETAAGDTIELENNGGMRKLKKGEFSIVERKFSKSGAFSFSGKEKIESRDDVAFIFRSLENFAIEHSFAVLVKDGKPCVIHLNMGHFASTPVNKGAIRAAYEEFGADKIYFIHNHPSGNLKSSPEDLRMLDTIKEQFKGEVEIEGLIIDTTSGRYGVLQSGTTQEFGSTTSSKGQTDIKILSFDRLSFSKDYDIESMPQVSNSQVVASFISSHRLGGRKKVSFLILDRRNQIVGNFHTAKSSYKDAGNLGREMTRAALKFGGVSVVPYGNVSLTGIQKVSDEIKRMSGGEVRLLDAIKIDNGLSTESAYDNNLLRESDIEYNQLSNIGDIRYRIREDEPPTNTEIGYKVFVLKDGMLYPPMVANPNGAPTPVGVWLDADAAPVAGTSKTGRQQVKAGGKGTQGGSGKLAYRPGWHLGIIPYALQFNRKSESGEKELFPANFVWAEVEYADDIDSQEEAMSYGYNKNGKFQHSYAGLPRLPINGAYKYRTNPNPETDPWIITGAMKVNRLLTPTEVDEMVIAAGREPQKRQDGAVTDEQINELNTQFAQGERAKYDIHRDAEIFMGNDPWSKSWGESISTKRQQKEFAERERERMRECARSLSTALGVDIEIIEDPSTLTGKKQRAKGWYDTKTGKITVVVGNHNSAADMEATILHEAVAHHGLRQLLGDHFNEFLDKVYEAANSDIKERIDLLATQNGWNRRVATEEYLAGLAEDTDFEKAEERFGGWFDKVKRLFLDMLVKAGFKYVKPDSLSDYELRYILWRSYQNLAHPGRHRAFEWEAEDVAMQYQLEVGEYAPKTDDITEQSVAEAGKITELNERFNAELADLTEDNADKIIFSLGSPSEILLAGGVDNRIMKLYGNKVIKKMKKHGFMLSELQNLPEAVAKPIAIFNNIGRKGNRSILTELKTVNGNFLVTIDLGKGGDDIDFNIVSSIFGKEKEKVISWIEKGYATYMDKRKVLSYLHHSAPIAEALSSSRLDSATKIVENFENPVINSQNNNTLDDDTVLFRDGDFTPRDSVIAAHQYENMLKRGSWQFREATQDSMLGLKTLYESILGDNKTRIEDVAGYENAYLYENRMSSANNGEQHQYFVQYLKPILGSIYELCGKNDLERRILTDYMIAKHGLERNAYMRNEAAAKGEDTERDFAGLCGLTGEADWQTAENVAQQMVDDYESHHDTAELWDNVRKATNATLEKIYLSGLISGDTYSKVLGMYDYYVPLRGWDETTSDEVYGYLTSKDGPLLGGVFKSAEGRKSKADDPVATIAMMADDAIRQGNRNIMKQRFLNFVHGNPSDLVSVNELWLQYNNVTDEWEPVFADLIPDMTHEEVESEIAKFEAKMEALRAADPDKYNKGRGIQNIPYKVVKGNLNEHQVLVKRNGHTYVMTINGNPRAAQALNGLTNPNVEMGGVVGNMLKLGEYINRNLSAFYTTRNPDFVVGNFLRDMLYSNCMTWVKENPRYALRFHKNIGKVNPVTLRRLLSKWEKNNLNDSDYLEKMFKEFMLNGGETGYTSVKDIEGHKRTIASELKKQGSTERKAWSALGVQLDLLNRSAENCARFAAFLTSREMGRTLDRSIHDAKEVSVNFNKKGSGGKFVNATGQKFLGKVGAYLGGGGRMAFVFWNAGIQGMTNFGRAAKRHPGKAISGAATLFTLGYVIPLLAQMLGGGDGDDDDKNAYYNLPEYVRRSNICFKTGDQWITIPLPIEYRAIYGMGELACGVITGNERYSDSEVFMQMAAQVSQALPLDMLEGGGGISPFIPSAFKPLTEAYILNKGWTGLPVYKDNPFNKNDPEWTKAYQSADQHLVAFTRWLNETSGGNDYKKGAIDINPAKLEYLLSGTFGGAVSTTGKLKKMGETALGKREFEWRNMLLANRVVKSGDERTANRKLQNEYFKYLNEYEETNRLRRKYENAADDGILGYAERADFLYNSPEYLRFEIFEEYKTDIDAIRQEIKEETDPKAKDELSSELFSTMRELVDELHKVGK